MRKRVMKMIKNQTLFCQALPIVGLLGGLVSGSEFVNAEESYEGIEEIVVTARKREESLQDVPVSVTAFSAGDIEAKSIKDLKQLSQFSPNLTMTSDGNDGGLTTNVTIRGIGNSIGGPGVGVYLDGVYLGSQQGINLDLIDIERVEVLRGPQGTLFGRNTIGGAVSLVSKRPASEFEGSFEFTFGKDDRRDAVAGVSLPLIEDKLNGYFAVGSQRQDGYGDIRDINTNEAIDEMGDTDKLSGRVMLDFNATENLNMLLSINSQEVNEKSSVRSLRRVENFAPGGFPTVFGVFNIGLGALGLSPIVNSPNDYTSYGAGDNFNESDAFDVALTIDWDLGDTFLGSGTTLKSISSHRNLNTHFAFNIDFGPTGITEVNNRANHKQSSQEFQLSSLSFDDRLIWVLGLYYYEEEDDLDAFASFGQLVAPVLAGPPFFFPVPPPILFHDELERETWSIFGQGTLSVTDKFSITAGLRYTEDDLETLEELFLAGTNLLLEPSESLSMDDEEVTGRLSFEYKWNEDVMTYASVAKGFKSGGVTSGVGDLTSPVGPVVFLPEVVWTYELGLRSTWLDNRLRANLTAFYTDYTDIQYTYTFVRAGQPVGYASNGPEAETQGIELELLYAPTGNLTLSASYGHVDSEYLKADPSGGPLTKDSKFVDAPENSFTFAVDYMIPTEFGELRAHVDYAWNDLIYFDIQNTADPDLQQDDYDIVNARVSLALESGLTLSVFGTNLGDEEYLLSAFSAGDLGIASLVQPARQREWGISVKYDF